MQSFFFFFFFKRVFYFWRESGSAEHVKARSFFLHVVSFEKSYKVTLVSFDLYIIFMFIS